MEGTADQPVQIDCDDLQFFADHMELFQKEGRVIAIGNVTYISGGNQIEAERMLYYTKTRTGTFYNATGTAVLRESAQPGIFGSQEPDAYFWGEELQKIGPKTYRIIKGGFTTCVQPAPRWDLEADSITMHLDDYALMKNAVFRVKNVPLMFLPVFYYPIQEDNRATGFLMPIYGTSDPARPVAHESVLLGHQPEPRRDDRTRLVFEDRPAGRRRVSICFRARLAGKRADVVLE